MARWRKIIRLWFTSKSEILKTKSDKIRFNLEERDYNSESLQLVMMMIMTTVTIMSSYRIHANNQCRQQKEIMFTKNNCGRIELVLPFGSQSSHPCPFTLLVNSDIWSRPDRHLQFSAMIWNFRCSLDSIIVFSSEEVPIKVTYILSDCTLSQTRKPLVEV